jgi:tetratricopeptide (TPR) repeat protein
MDAVLLDSPALDDRLFLEFLILATPADLKGKYVKTIAYNLYRRWETSGLAEDLDRSMELFQKALELTPIDSVDYASCLGLVGELSTGPSIRREPSLEDITRFIELNENALSSIDNVQSNSGVTVDYISYPHYLYNLSILFDRRFACTGSMDDLNTAITMAQQLVKTMPRGYRPRPDAEVQQLIQRLQRVSVQDFDQANEMIRESETTMLGNGSMLPYNVYFSQLRKMLHSRFQRTGSLQDLNDAIVAAEKAAEYTPKDDKAFLTYLNEFGEALYGRYERTGALDDLNRSITVLEQMVQLLGHNC